MRIFIGADVVPTKERPNREIYSESAFVNGEVDLLFSDMLPIMRGADRVIVNLECALTEHDGAIKKIGPNIKASPLCAHTLKLAGVTDCTLANNHVFDYGVKGLLDTTNALKKEGILYTGIGENDRDSRRIHYIEEKGKRVAIVNVCEHEYTYALKDRMGANPFDPFLTMADIRQAKKNADFVVVLYHGGKENCPYPSPRLANACREMAHNGASVVITQHSHCIGCYEEYEGCHILYGQGNFHFALRGEDTPWSQGLAVVLDIGERVGLELYPFVVKDITLSLAKGEEYKEIMEPFFERNEHMKSGQWEKGWQDFCQSVKDFYIETVNGVGKTKSEDACEYFAHYLDCEAHTDVWRELYKTANFSNEKEAE